MTQRFIGEKVAGFVSDLIGSQVSIGRVDVGLLNRIIIDNLVIEEDLAEEEEEEHEYTK